MPEQVPKFYKNPAIATVLSFLWAGLGQIYNGEIGKGILFMVLYAFSFVFAIGLLMLSFRMPILRIGLFATPILWIWGMKDANASAKRINEKLASQ
jgi:TM2 domain-containing membrane protein YozV